MKVTQEYLQNIKWLRTKLLSWYKLHGRSFPWRETENPYEILVAELLLRRTWAKQVEPIYIEFIKKYPTIKALNKADPSSLKDLLWPLGLHDRSTQIMKISSELLELYDGIIPKNRDKLVALSGVGDYIAGAVLSFAYNQPEWIVDANVIRIFRRFLDLNLPSDAHHSKKIISIAKEYSDNVTPRESNFAILDYAFLVCTPTKPKCFNCSVQEKCIFKQIKDIQS